MGGLEQIVYLLRMCFSLCSMFCGEYFQLVPVIGEGENRWSTKIDLHNTECFPLYSIKQFLAHQK